MFQFRPFPTYDYFIHRTLLWYCHSGFPHSEISGSKLICSYPKLIAACRVLHRLLMPRHSPCALYSLTYLVQLLISCSRIMQASISVNFRNCNCYPFVGTILNRPLKKFHNYKVFALPLCCLAFFFVLCSVFKVQTAWMILRSSALLRGVPSKLNIVRTSGKGLT